MSRFILGLILGMMLMSGVLYAQSLSNENLADFDKKYISVLNDQLRQMRRVLRNHEARIVALEP